MEQIHIDTLQKYKKEIIDDVNVTNGIIKHLEFENILKDEDVRTILKGKKPEERASILLDLLPGCGPFAFEEFCKALQLHYNWLRDSMEKHLAKSGMSNSAANHINDLPPCPPLSVTRKEKVIKLKELLGLLRPGQHLALHGLKGFGKSCLTVMTLKDTHLVAELFQNEIYWLKFSYSGNRAGRSESVDEKKVDEEILIQLNALNQRITKSDYIPSPIECEPLKECLERLIKMHFGQKDHENALLILHDVSHKKIVDTFSFGCKTLVITEDLSVVNEKLPHILEVSDGFTKPESLRLFAKVLDIPMNQLPPEAKQIHEECKGMPLLISMFSAQLKQFKEQMIKEPSRWRHYLTCLRKRDPKNRAIQTQTAIFDMVIKKLKPHLRELYFELSIFNEDVNITTMTLEILWGMEPAEVGDLMLILCHKSLAARQWNEELRCYVYGVHDLLLSHLRMKLTPKILKKKHRFFIRKYQDVSKNDFSKLPDDNYSYSFIGHHLEQAKLYDLFEKVYLSLEFAEAKITNTGLRDLLIDLEKYKKYITRNYSEDLLLKLADLEKFLKAQRSVLMKHGIRKCLDIVQIALYHAEEGFVMDQARELANKRSFNLYLLRTKNLGNVSSTENISASESTIDSFNEDVYTFCFTDDPKSLLFATKNGTIVEKNFLHKKTKYFVGLEGKIIKKLQMSNGGKYCLALTNIEEGIAKLFCLKEEEASDEKKDQSPRAKQNFWTGVINKTENKYESLLTLYILNECMSDVAFSPNDEFIAGCTPNGTVKVWKKNGEEIYATSIRNNVCLKKITFSTDLHQNMLLHVFDENNCAFTVYKLSNNRLEYMTTINPQIKERNEEIEIIFFRELPREKNSLILVTKNKAVYITWQQIPNHDQIHSFKIEARTAVDDPNAVFVSATVTYDGQYLITAKSDGNINVWKIHNNFAPFAIYKGKVSCLDTYWLEKAEKHLFCGNEDKLIQMWEFDQIEEPKPLNKPLFNALMKPLGKDDMVVRRTSDKKIVVTQGNQTSWREIAETGLVEGLVTTMILTPDGTQLIYDVVKEGTQEIFLFDIQKNHHAIKRILSLKQVSNFIKLVTNFVTGVAIVVQEKDTLKVWQNLKSPCYLIPDVGEVISVYEVGEQNVLTVTRNFHIMYWDIFGSTWQLLQTQSRGSTNSTAISSTLSTGRTYLAVLNDNRKNIVLYNITENFKVNPVQVMINVYHEISRLSDKVTCFEFSKDEKYLAIGFYKGDISIFDMEEQIEIRKISFHSNPVSEFHWAHSSIKIPILLSVNSEELVWWNVAPIVVPSSRKQSRMGTSTENTPSPRSSFKVDRINCVENGNGMKSENDDSCEKFWHKKLTKLDELPLLCIVPLPSCVGKVCVSEDFNKFLMIDNNGYITIFTLLAQRNNCSLVEL